MSITILRNTGWMGSVLEIQIIINEEKVTTINEKQSVEVELPNDQAYLKVKQFGIKSKEIVVEDGDVLEIQTTLDYRISFYIGLFILMATQILTIYLSNLKYRKIVLVIGLILVVFINIRTFFINGYYIKDINSDYKK